MNDKRKRQQHVEKMIHKVIPSQVPTHCVKASYDRMILHAKTFGSGAQSIWGCALSGAPVHARMVKMYIFDRLTGAQIDYAPVVTLYCSACDKIPDTHGGDSLFSDQLQTLSM